MVGVLGDDTGGNVRVEKSDCVGDSEMEKGRVFFEGGAGVE